MAVRERTSGFGTLVGHTFPPMPTFSAVPVTLLLLSSFPFFNLSPFFLMLTTQLTHKASFLLPLFTPISFTHTPPLHYPTFFQKLTFLFIFPLLNSLLSPLCPFPPFPPAFFCQNPRYRIWGFVFLVSSDTSWNCQLASLSFLSGILTSGVPALFYRHNTIFPYVLSRGFSVMILA